jgi:hypothetical protein
MLVVSAWVCALGCAEEAEPEPDAPALDVPVVEDLPGSFAAALALAAAPPIDAAWAGLTEGLARGTNTCPDVWLDPPDAGPGFGWKDRCATGGTSFVGSVAWSSDAERFGDVSTAEGRTSLGERSLDGAASVETDDGLLWAFDGQASEVVTHTDAVSYTQWTWSTRLRGTVRGAVLGQDPESGLRADLSAFATGGASWSLEVAGDLHLLDGLLAAQFDSVALDLRIAGEGPECTEEPSGWIGLRLPDATWFDAVFQPRDEPEPGDAPYANDPYGGCEGCATLYVRGLEQGEVCLDFSFLLEGREPPDVATFLLPLRERIRETP